VAKYKAYGVAVAPIPKEIEDEMAKQADIFYKEQAAKDALFNEIYTSLTTFQKTIRESAARL
jgi:TRAP-type mannitol/chloroaromatic compound transport system substrate-binding protein